ncbi:hypothetical protein EV379_2955 [Microterricola gilva]|uniref:PQ loop repeat protein n=1 Tax=Microterricola gilva TaxID=393267 RepID=A0A4Q8AR34_9MICO|nr:hypothetical protein [Microterricola gilva]RZU66593.1 hypothetical protein EV379_2955 [Microterricola gilva]
MNLPLLAGAISTVLFAVSYLPMLAKAVHTRDLSSYSLVNIATTNVANGLYSLYVFSLPVGPIWFLHGFYLLASALMLVWFIRFRAVAERAVDVGRGRRIQMAAAS